MYYKTYYESILGTIVLVSDGESLVGLWLENQKYYLGAIRSELIVNNNLLIFQKTKQWLDKYFKGENPTINELILNPIGTDFQKKVWNILCEIPYGRTVTYGQIAKRITHELHRKNMSSQAIGSAVGHNPISIIIPCHRVVGANGSLTGYAGGIDKKIQLLTLEKANRKHFFVTKKSTAKCASK